MSRDIHSLKKICILSCSNIKHMSLITLYTDILKEKNIAYDIIYMDKYGEDEFFDSKEKYRYENKINPKSNKLAKLLRYMKFKSYAEDILNKNSYDFIIVWNEITAIMFNNYLSKKWKEKYSLNYRDYLYQDFPIVSFLNKRVIKNSAFTTISSDAFKTFLPKHDYIHIHSFNESLLKNVFPRKKLQENHNKIRLTFIGNIRFMDQNIKLLDIFKNDSRFELHFYGTNAEILERYSKDNQISNAFFASSFPIEQTSMYIKRTDIVNNLYGNNKSSLDYALSIKLYYGVYYRTPIIVNSNTYMADIVEKYDIGLVIQNLTVQLPNEIYEWYENIDFVDFNRNCENFILQIKNNKKIFDKKVEEYLL